MQRLSLFIVVVLGISGHLQAQNPHGDALVIDCKACHNSGSWEAAIDESLFSHSQTGFELEGQHANIECKECHSSLVFDEVENTCIACHTDVHSMSVGNDCARCHDSENWLVDNIPELHEQNGFPLLGEHRMTACVDCHVSESNLRWDRIGNDCSSCHLPEFMATTDPNHQAAGFSMNCVECHEPTAEDWGAENFHLFFPLEGGHNVQDCNACHDGSNFAAASPECVSCHLTDFNATTQPNHTAAGFSTDCIQCHDPMATNWGASNFHNFFPLEGGHNIQDCNACHDGTNYSAASPECVSCHLQDYQNVQSPNHVTNGFGTDCIQCHTTNDWNSVSFEQHDALYFPIFSGKHKDAWVNCNECHTNTGDFTTFSCIDCHEHNDPQELADDHDEEPGYVYESNACYACHPTGEE